MEKRRFKYTAPMAGLGKVSRGQLVSILRKAAGTITPGLAAETLKLPQIEAAQLLARWAKQGWLQRVHRGIYVPVVLESERADSSPEDAWIIAEAAFTPCYPYLPDLQELQANRLMVPLL